MPSVGQTTDELVIVEWFKKEGDTVALGESLFSVQTDKAQVEVESVAAGTLLKVLRDAGETVQSGSPVAYIGAPGEAVPDVHAVLRTADDPDVRRASARSRRPRSLRARNPSVARQKEHQAESAALPAARRLASALGIDLTTLARHWPGWCHHRPRRRAWRRRNRRSRGRPEGGAT